MFHVLTNTPLSYSSISRKCVCACACVCVCVPVCACVCRHIHFVPVSFHNETNYYIIIIGDIKKTITVEVGNMQKISVNLFKRSAVIKDKNMPSLFISLKIKGTFLSFCVPLMALNSSFFHLAKVVQNSWDTLTYIPEILMVGIIAILLQKIFLHTHTNLQQFKVSTFNHWRFCSWKMCF